VYIRLADAEAALPAAAAAGIPFSAAQLDDLDLVLDVAGDRPMYCPSTVLALRLAHTFGEPVERLFWLEGETNA
jgi:hypothetical protein